MRFLLPYFIIFIVVLQLYLRKNNKKHENSEKDFWKRENAANTVRKKDISQLPYIEIPKTLPWISENEMTAAIKKQQDIILSLQNQKILNLTGISNTELKEQYGVANLTELTNCDDRFAKLCRALVALSKELLTDSTAATSSESVTNTDTVLTTRPQTETAVAFLEYGIEIGSDITANYTMLATIYADRNDLKKLTHLKDSANKLNSLSKAGILQKLSEYENTMTNR